jgi:DNA-binding MarR family transcriptional regulator
LQAHHNGVVALIDRCEKLDLVARNPGQNDRRVVEVHLRPKGVKMLARIAAQHQDELQVLLKAFAQTDDRPLP